MELTPEQNEFIGSFTDEWRSSEAENYFCRGFTEAQTPKALILNPLVAGLVFRLNQATDYFRERDWPGVTEHYEESLKPFEKYLKGDE